MAKKKRRVKRGKTPLRDIKEGPIRHKEGLSPLLEKLARAIFQKVGHFVHPSFEHWELGFMRDLHPWREILVWETIARTVDLYLSKHPDTVCSKEIVGTLASISTGHVPQNATDTENELRNLFIEAHKRQWISLLEEPFEFPPGEAPVLEYGDIVDEKDGMIYPNIRGEVDCRRMLADADIIIGMASTSGDQFCIYGRDRLDEGGVPEGLRTLVVQLDPENKDTHELEKICAVVQQIKGRHDYH